MKSDNTNNSNINNSNIIDNITKIIEVVDDRSKIINEITGIVKSVISKDPKAMDDNFAAYFLKNTFGESSYETIKKVYLDIIEVKRSWLIWVKN